MIDAHHHLWDMSKVKYPWLEAKGTERFFGMPDPIRNNYLPQVKVEVNFQNYCLCFVYR